MAADLVPKEQLLDGMRASIGEFIDAARSLSPERWEEGRYEEGWTAKDILAHVASVEWTFPKILVMAQHGMVGPMQTDVDTTYLADTVILLRYFEAMGEVRQALSVIKKRTGVHEDTTGWRSRGALWSCTHILSDEQLGAPTPCTRSTLDRPLLTARVVVVQAYCSG